MRVWRKQESSIRGSRATGRIDGRLPEHRQGLRDRDSEDDTAYQPQKSRFWLYVTHARKAFITKEFGASLGIPRVSFADESLMLQVLGTPHGAATPFGLLRDEAKEVVFVMDEDVAARDKIVITDGDACGFIAIANADLFRLLGRSPILIQNPAPLS